MLKSSYVSSWGESWLQAANGRLHLTRHRVQHDPAPSVALNCRQCPAHLGQQVRNEEKYPLRTQLHQITW